MSDVEAPEVSRAIFGGVFDIDGAGHYPGLELINFILCSDKGVLPQDKEVRLTRVAHDFARRLIRDDCLPENAKRNVIFDAHSEKAIARLLRSLELNLSNVSTSKTWERTHFFPYTRSLVHWDARVRFNRIILERRYFRGAGTYAFFVLRHDPDVTRLERIRDGFLRLYPEQNASPLDLLAKTLRNAGMIDEKSVVDTIEGQSRLIDDEWGDLYRTGIDNILSHHSASIVERVRAVVIWTGLWSIFMMAGRTASALNLKNTGFILDCAGIHSQLRRVSQKNYKSQLANIEQVVNKKAEELGGELTVKTLGKIKGYFGSTVVACGVGNALKGRRHFTLHLEAVDALVMAGLKEGAELEFERFVTEWLYKRCRLVIGRNAAEVENLLSDLDATIFEENERSLAEQMHSAGMLKMYSDATRMVSYGGSR